MNQKIPVKNLFWVMVILCWILLGASSQGRNSAVETGNSPEKEYFRTSNSFVREVARIENEQMPERSIYCAKKSGVRLFLWLLVFLTIGAAWKNYLSSSYCQGFSKKKQKKDACRIFERRGPPEKQFGAELRRV